MEIPNSQSALLVEQLTPREMEVLRLVAAGQANKEIADELVVVLDTAKKHVHQIMRKLGARNRTQSVAHARAVGLLD
jgi:LuxR family transcriptional regulator, maltose regulon positive regulatory protein